MLEETKEGIEHFFVCSVCHHRKPVQKTGGTGYGIDEVTKYPVCYDCCAIRDKVKMCESGRVTLYLTVDFHEYLNNGNADYHCGKGWRRCSAHLTNWPGTLKFDVRSVKVGRHNVAGARYDVWFKGPDGANWHGVQYGDNTQLCHCRRLRCK